MPVEKECQTSAVMATFSACLAKAQLSQYHHIFAIIFASVFNSKEGRWLMKHKYAEK